MPSKNTRICNNIYCESATRTKDLAFCSYCWFRVSARLRAQYYRARWGPNEDRATTNIVRALERLQHAS